MLDQVRIIFLDWREMRRGLRETAAVFFPLRRGIFSIFDVRGKSRRMTDRALADQWLAPRSRYGTNNAASASTITRGKPMIRALLVAAFVLSMMPLVSTADAGNCQTSSDRAADGSRCGDRAADRRPGGQ